MAPPPAEPEVFNPTTRALCPDGACVGVLDGTGVCPVCGRRGSPASTQGSPRPSDALAFEPPSDEAGASSQPATHEATRHDDVDGFDSQRRLCPDGTCLGVLGAHGRCDVCGRAAS